MTPSALSDLSQAELQLSNTGSLSDATHSSLLLSAQMSVTNSAELQGTLASLAAQVNFPPFCVLEALLCACGSFSCIVFLKMCCLCCCTPVGDSGDMHHRFTPPHTH